MGSDLKSLFYEVPKLHMQFDLDHQHRSETLARLQREGCLKQRAWIATQELENGIHCSLLRAQPCPAWLCLAQWLLVFK